MVFKWTLVVFGVAAGALFVLGKVLAVMHPALPGRPRPPILLRVERALRWVVLVPLAIAVGLLVLALGGKP